MLGSKSCEVVGTIRPRHTLPHRTYLPVLACIILVIVGCHRTDFDADQTTICPEPEGSLVVLEYTINCLYVGDQPETGCPEIAPNDYLFADTFICSERSGATNAFLQDVIDSYLDIDANIIDASVSDTSVPFSDLTSTVDGGTGDDAREPTMDDAAPATTDDTPPANNMDECESANDGVCDEPDLCAVGTDADDCNPSNGQTPQQSEP